MTRKEDYVDHGVCSSCDLWATAYRAFVRASNERVAALEVELSELRDEAKKKSADEPEADDVVCDECCHLADDHLDSGCIHSGDECMCGDHDEGDDDAACSACSCRLSETEVLRGVLTEQREIAALAVSNWNSAKSGIFPPAFKGGTGSWPCEQREADGE